jgi:BirA family transcriptional regulator, biotin operon repressor / biotin---[acetyl-CoA-carboxylase] ligase
MIIGSNLNFYKNLSSTNDQASLLLKTESPPEGTVIYTDSQSAGRGQKNNKWESDEGKNLLISIILYPRSIAPEDQFYISMAVSLGICDFIDSFFPGSKIKWPNDIYIKNDKIAGILIENSILGKTIESSVAGIGININQEKFSDVVPNPVSIKMVTGNEYDRVICLKQLLSDLDRRYKQLLYGDHDQIRKEYNLHLHRLGEWHSFKTEDTTVFQGRITEVLSSGILRIESNNNAIMEFFFKEVDFVN